MSGDYNILSTWKLASTVWYRFSIRPTQRTHVGADRNPKRILHCLRPLRPQKNAMTKLGRTSMH